MLIFRRTIVSVQHLVSSLSLGEFSVHRTQYTGSVHRLGVLPRNLYTEQSPKDSDDTRCCVNTIVLLKMSTTVLETCIGM